MITPRQLSRRARQNHRALIAVVAASATLFSVATVGLAAGGEIRSRAELRAEISDVSASIAGSTEVGSAVVASHLTASVCVAEVTVRLAAATGNGARFTPGAHGQVMRTVQGAADAAPVPAYDPAPPRKPRADLGVDELRSVLAELRSALAAAEAEVAALASAARATEQACASARAAEAVLVKEIVRRSDELIAANPKAAADTVATLRTTRDAVVAAEAGAVERWIAAAGAVESSHAAAVLAEQQAAEAAQQAAERERESTSADFVGLAPVSTAPPWRTPPSYEEFLAQCMASPLCNPFGTVGLDTPP